MEYIEKATQRLTLNEYIEFEEHFKKKAKKRSFAYLWWVIFGAFGGHRFYLGYYGTGLIILVVTLFTLGLGAIVGWLDVLNIKRLTENANKELVLNIVKDVKKK
ncbi:TM2 domain-containing protein [Bacillus cereus]|uniref:TM2 domain-containing protein n=1 Tax=Bacillus cereus TaxID=1396 RepID=UPI002AC223B1|nr:TM2 domain-containing protein [Bacillus cereus]MDZ4632258.1 TM2 domain-containing protein [Bacillus cereus]